MRLLQLNAWGGRLEPQIGDLLKTVKPDILCLQEAISFHEDGAGLFITLEAIQKDYNLPYLAFGPVFSFKYMEGTARFGNAVLSRFPITQSDVIFTHLAHKEGFMWGKDDGNMRNFVHSAVQIEGKTCHVISHHGFWVANHKNGTPDTLKQTQLIAEYVQELEGPVILTGDFNLVPSSESIAQINDVLTNLTLKHKLATTRTDLTTKTEACDYIFVNDLIKVETFKPLEKVVSDHKALLLEFEL